MLSIVFPFSVSSVFFFLGQCKIVVEIGSKYKLGYVKRGSTAFKVPKDGCGVPSVARALLGPEGLLMR